MTTTHLLAALATSAIAAILAPVDSIAAAPAQSPDRGTIRGHVRLLGKLPGNPVIRMRRDPACAKITAGQQVVQETVMANLKGDLANVFVKLVGDIPSGPPPPTTTVTVDQRGCIYTPRVIGLQAGQTLAIRNGDALLHNVRSSSSSIKENSFNVAQPIKGMVTEFRLKEEPAMLRLGCDLHSWMTAYVGVVSHPYFAVTGQMGSFEIRNVPAGAYSIQAWHEAYGPMTQTIRVRAGAPTVVEFSYTGAEKSPSTRTGA